MPQLEPAAMERRGAQNGQAYNLLEVACYYGDRFRLMWEAAPGIMAVVPSEDAEAAGGGSAGMAQAWTRGDWCTM